MKTELRPNIVKRTVLLKLEKPEGGPYEAICLYVDRSGSSENYIVVGHADFDVILYDGPSKNKSITLFYEMVISSEKKYANNIDDEL
jgi:hypothetical protein